MKAARVTTPEGRIPGSGLGLFFEVQRHIVSFLKWRFSLLPTGSYRYDLTAEGPEQKNSEIFIGMDTPLRPEVVGARPALTVLRSQAVGGGIGLGNLAFVDLATGAKVRMDMYPTNIMINVLSSEPAEAEALAGFILDQMSAFREAIVKESKGRILYIGSQPMISPPSPAGSLVESTEFDWTCIVMGYPCYVQHGVTALPLNKKILAGIDVNATVARPPPRPPAIVPLQGTAVAQPAQNAEAKASAVGDLPQAPPDEAQYTEPLTVQIRTR